MKSLVITLCLSLYMTICAGQSQKRLTSYLLIQYNRTMYDRTIGNNPWGLGTGLLTCYNNQSKFKPTLDITGDLYLEDDKVLRKNSDGTRINSVRSLVNLFGGTAWHPTAKGYVSMVAGPSFINGQVLLAIKPSVGFYFSERWTGKISYINVFNRDRVTNDDFGSLSLMLGVKLF